MRVNICLSAYVQSPFLAPVRHMEVRKTSGCPVMLVAWMNSWQLKPNSIKLGGIEPPSLIARHSVAAYGLHLARMRAAAQGMTGAR